MNDFLDSFNYTHSAIKTIRDTVVLLKTRKVWFTKVYFQTLWHLKRHISQQFMTKGPKLTFRQVNSSKGLNKVFLTFKLFNKNIPKTNTGIFSMVTLIFDPLCLILPIIVMAKILIKKICKRSVKWDQELPRDFINQLSLWNLFRICYQ